MRRKRWNVAGLLVLMLALGCGPTPVDGATAGAGDAQAAAAGVPQSTWDRSCRFAVELEDGGSERGLVFESQGSANMLGWLPGGSWFLLEPSRRRVLTLETESVDMAANHRQAVLKGALPTSGRPIKLSPSGLTFDLAGQPVRVMPMPALLGEVDPEEFLDLCPDFQDREDSYQPNLEMVGRIAQCQSDVTVEVFFGSWCPHCQQVLPRLIKCLRLADNAKLQVKWIGLPRSFAQEPRVKERNVKGVPTIIVFSGGEELGRFSGTDQTPVEVSLAQLVP